MEQTGASQDYDYHFSPETVEVTVQGLKDDLDAMSEEDLNAVLDLHGQTSGTRAGTLDFQVDEGLEILDSTPFQVTVSAKGHDVISTDAETEDDHGTQERETRDASENTENE